MDISAQALEDLAMEAFQLRLPGTQEQTEVQCYSLLRHLTAHRSPVVLYPERPGTDSCLPAHKVQHYRGTTTTEDFIYEDENDYLHCVQRLNKFKSTLKLLPYKYNITL